MEKISVTKAVVSGVNLVLESSVDDKILSIERLLGNFEKMIARRASLVVLRKSAQSEDEEVKRTLRDVAEDILKETTFLYDKTLIEDLSALEQEQWRSWSGSSTLYENLDDAGKAMNRVWASKSTAIMNEHISKIKFEYLELMIDNLKWAMNLHDDGAIDHDLMYCYKNKVLNEMIEKMSEDKLENIKREV